MGISSLLHAAILVRDLDASQYFYGTLLGLPLAERSLSFPGLWYQIGPQQLHLIQVDALKPDRLDEARWGRNRHIAFAVADLDAMQTRLQAAGVALQPSSSGRPALFATDPDGNIIELAQV